MPIILDGTTGITTPGITNTGTFVFQGPIQVPAGTAASPSVTTASGGHTGLYFPSSSSVALSTTGTQRFVVDSSGNAGLGVTPSAWNSSVKAIEIPYGSLWNLSDAVYLGTNYFLNSSAQRIYSNTGKFALEYLQYALDGSHRWYNAPSGTAGNSVTLTQAMALDSSGNLGLGVTPTNNTLGKSIQNGQAAAWVSETGSNRFWLGSNWYFSGGDKYINNGFATLYTQQSGQHLWLISASGTVGGTISFTQAMTLDASANLGINTTTPALTAGYTYVTINNGSNGTALSFRESNTERAALFYSHGDNTLNLWGLESGSVIRFATSDSEKVRITSGGNVGIGTTSPNGKLQFAADINARKVVLYEGANNDYQFYGFGVLSATLLYSTYSVGDDHVFAVGTSSTTRTELARINSTYNALQVPGQPGFKIAWADRDATGSDRILGTNQGDSLASEARDTFNQGSHYSTATGRFTCPVAGMYLFGFSVMRNATNGTLLDIRIKKNGVTMYARAYASTYTSNYQQGIIVTITDASTNDYFEFFVSGSTSIYNDDTYVFGYLIG